MVPKANEMHLLSRNILVSPKNVGCLWCDVWVTKTNQIFQRPYLRYANRNGQQNYQNIDVL